MRNVYRKFRRMWQAWRLTFHEKVVGRFAFVHINKTGGTSIAKALGIPAFHYTALEKIDRLGRERWSRLFTFAFVRNPWDKVVSHYHYRVKTNQSGLRERPLGFNAWVRLAYIEQDPNYYDHPRMFMPQMDWIANRDGEVLVDFVGRFEHLDRDFRTVCDRLRITAELPHEKKSDRGAYQDYYDDESRAFVAEWFEKDIGRFAYKF